jgi:hypothetical protein
LTDSFELEGGEYQIYLALSSEQVIAEGTVFLEGISFEPQPIPEKLEPKEAPTEYTLDSPAGILFENETFRQYVRDNNLPIDLEDFEKKHFWIDSKALRVTICDGDFNITFEEMEKLVAYLNKHSQIDRRINFDETVRKYLP